MCGGIEGGELVKGVNINHPTLPLQIGICVSRLPAVVVYWAAGRVLMNAARFFRVGSCVSTVELWPMSFEDFCKL